MTNLSDKDIADDLAVLETENYASARWQRGIAALRELQQLRSAQRADAERVRGVVLRIAGDVLEHPDAKVVRNFDTASAIADRVAAELATPAPASAPVLSAEERELVVAWTNWFRKEHPTYARLVDRLLGGGS